MTPESKAEISLEIMGPQHRPPFEGVITPTVNCLGRELSYLKKSYALHNTLCCKVQVTSGLLFKAIEEKHGLHQSVTVQLVGVHPQSAIDFFATLYKTLVSAGDLHHCEVVKRTDQTTVNSLFL